jgi:hypothetical protein
VSVTHRSTPFPFGFGAVGESDSWGGALERRVGAELSVDLRFCDLGWRR